MSDQNINIKVGPRARGGGVSLFTIAILLMVSGAVVENLTEHIELGMVLFAIGFWLFIIPLIIIGIVFGIFLLVLVFAS